MRLSGKVAIVTGSAVGLGRAVATRFAREGALVVVTDTNAGDGTAAIDQIHKDGGHGIFVPADVSEEREVIALIESTVAEFKRIDVLYNNAAVLFHEQDVRAHELSLDTWDQVMRVNLQALFFAPNMRFPSC